MLKWAAVGVSGSGGDKTRMDDKGITMKKKPRGKKKRRRLDKDREMR